jgi:hypothetical protein
METHYTEGLKGNLRHGKFDRLIFFQSYSSWLDMAYFHFAERPREGLTVARFIVKPKPSEQNKNLN